MVKVPFWYLTSGGGNVILFVSQWKRLEKEILVEKFSEVSTSINLMGNEKEWELYTDNTRIIAKMKKIGLTAYKENSNGGLWFKVPVAQLLFRNKPAPRKQMTDEQKALAGERMRKMQKNRTREVE